MLCYRTFIPNPPRNLGLEMFGFIKVGRFVFTNLDFHLGGYGEALGKVYEIAENIAISEISGWAHSLLWLPTHLPLLLSNH